MIGRLSMLILILLFISSLARGQDNRHEHGVPQQILPADSGDYSDPSIQRDMEEWLSKMPNTIAPNQNDILAPVEPDFLAKAALKDKPNFVEPDWKGIMTTPHCTEQNMQLERWGKWISRQPQEQAGGAMTAGISVSVGLQEIVNFLCGKLKIKSKRQKRKEKLQKILEEY